MKRAQEELVGSSPNKLARSAEVEEEEEAGPSGQTLPQRYSRPRTFMSWNVNSTCLPHLLGAATPHALAQLGLK
jgi:hypothetical protein